MKTTCVIAEFNPFHNGHQYIAQKARELTGADYVIALMSGDFVQRGAPAIIGRQVRAKMALASGFDMILAFPTRYATCSAEEYAAHAVRIADELGCIDTIFFGSECGDARQLANAARILASEPDEYRNLLQEFLRQGYPFPKARALALPDFDEILSKPNNILGIEYIKAILRRRSGLIPATCARIGTEHTSQNLSGEYASATAIRCHLLNQYMNSKEIRAHDPTKATDHGMTNFPDSARIRYDDAMAKPFIDFGINKLDEKQCNTDDASSDRLPDIQRSIPAPAFSILKEEYDNGRMLRDDDLSFLLAASIWQTSSADELTKFLSVTPQLANAIFSEKELCTSFMDFAMHLKNRSLTLTHITRALLHIALKIEKDKPLSDIAHILGFRRDAAPLISHMKETSSIPVILRPSRDLAGLDAKEYALFDEEIKLSNLYNVLVSQKTGQPVANELSHRLITF